MRFGRLGFRKSVQSSGHALQSPGLYRIKNLPTRKAAVDEIADTQRAGLPEGIMEICVMLQIVD